MSFTNEQDNRPS